MLSVVSALKLLWLNQAAKHINLWGEVFYTMPIFEKKLQAEMAAMDRRLQSTTEHFLIKSALFVHMNATVLGRILQ